MELAAILAQLYAQRERQAAQARAEAGARADLEAMVLRIERHIKVQTWSRGVALRDSV